MTVEKRKRVTLKVLLTVPAAWTPEQIKQQVAEFIDFGFHDAQPHVKVEQEDVFE